jgi:hypothetical protein
MVTGPGPRVARNGSRWPWVRRRSILCVLATLLITLVGCAPESQTITNSDASLSYQLGGDWKPAHLYLPFPEGGGSWSGVAQVGPYQCGSQAESRAMVGGASYTVPTDEDTALTIAAGSLLVSVLGAEPPAQLPAPGPARDGPPGARALDVTVHPERPGCGPLSVALDVLAVPVPGSGGAFRLFFLAADRSGGPATSKPITAAERAAVLDSVRSTG